MSGSAGPLGDWGPGTWPLHVRAAAFPDADRELPPPPTFGQGWAGLGLQETPLLRKPSHLPGPCSSSRPISPGPLQTPLKAAMERRL